MIASRNSKKIVFKMLPVTSLIWFLWAAFHRIFNLFRIKNYKSILVLLEYLSKNVVGYIFVCLSIISSQSHVAISRYEVELLYVGFEKIHIRPFILKIERFIIMLTPYYFSYPVRWWFYTWPTTIEKLSRQNYCL